MKARLVLIPSLPQGFKKSILSGPPPLHLADKYGLYNFLAMIKKLNE